MSPLCLELDLVLSLVPSHTCIILSGHIIPCLPDLQLHSGLDPFQQRLNKWKNPSHLKNNRKYPSIALTSTPVTVLSPPFHGKLLKGTV